jgi:hypothetical protein
MQAFRSKLAYWFPHIKRKVHATEIKVVPGGGGEFTVMVKWPGGEYQKQFSRQLVFGPHLKSTRQRPKKRVCAFRDDLIREVRQRRGI